jgi:hypothetical protein
LTDCHQLGKKKVEERKQNACRYETSMRAPVVRVRRMRAGIMPRLGVLQK